MCCQRCDVSLFPSFEILFQTYFQEVSFLNNPNLFLFCPNVVCFSLFVYAIKQSAVCDIFIKLKWNYPYCNSIPYLKIDLPYKNSLECLCWLDCVTFWDLTCGRLKNICLYSITRVLCLPLNRDGMPGVCREF